MLYEKKISQRCLHTRIKVTDVEDISELQDEIKKKYGDKIPAPPVDIQLFKSHTNEQIATMADYRALPNDYFLEDGPRVGIHIPGMPASRTNENFIKLLNVVYNDIPTRIDVATVQDISQLRRLIKKKYGDKIPAPPVDIQLFKSHTNEPIESMDEANALPNDYFVHRGPSLEIQILNGDGKSKDIVKEAYTLSQTPTWVFEMLQDFLFQRPASSVSNITQRDFKTNVCNYYGLKFKEGKLRCQLLDMKIPSKLAIAAHLFRKSRAKYMPAIIGIDNIDSERNGLILYKSIEHEYDNFGLCFVKEDNQFVMKVLNPKLLSMTFEDHMNTINRTLVVPEELKSKTFADFNNKPLVLKDPLKSPYSRCLGFQAKTARAYAIQQGWKKEGEFEFDNYWSHDDLVDKAGIVSWLANVPNEIQPPDASVGSLNSVEEF